MVFIEGDSFRDLRRLPTDAFRSIPRLPREDVALPVAASDLVAWYPFRSGTGEDLTAGDSNFGDTTDYSGTVQGVSFTQGPVTDIKTGANSQAAVGDGTDDIIDIPDNTCSFNTASGNITVCFWARAENTQQEFPLDVANPFQTDIKKASSQRAGQFSVNTFDGSNVAFAGADFTVGVLDHFAFVHNNNELRAHKNGQRVETTQTFDTRSINLDVALFDAPSRSGMEYEGLLDDVRIYQGGLSDSQINQIYLNTKS